MEVSGENVIDSGGERSRQLPLVGHDDNQGGDDRLIDYTL